MLFKSKLSVFSPLTISLGPLYAERVFDSHLTLEEGYNNVVRMAALDRYTAYLAYLKKLLATGDHKHYALIQFYMGYFSHRLADHLNGKDNQLHFREKALCHYQCYLDLPAYLDETRFYAQWQAGVLQEVLGYPWSQAEVCLLKAHDVDPVRGEGHHHIVKHYVRDKKWQEAYQYSTVIITKFFEHNPIAIRRWHVDFDAYNWTLLNTHLTICYKLHNLKEAENTYYRMLRHETEHLQDFKNKDIRYIHHLERLFRYPEKQKKQPAAPLVYQKDLLSPLANA